MLQIGAMDLAKPSSKSEGSATHTSQNGIETNQQQRAMQNSENQQSALPPGAAAGGPQLADIPSNDNTTSNPKKQGKLYKFITNSTLAIKIFRNPFPHIFS